VFRHPLKCNTVGIENLSQIDGAAMAGHFHSQQTEQKVMVRFKDMVTDKVCLV
jgi:hypothetical protein